MSRTTHGYSPSPYNLLINCSHNYLVYTLPDPPTIKSPDQAVAPDTPVTLECRATNADDNTEMVWIDSRGREIDK